jgi:hypothetical protein
MTMSRFLFAVKSGRRVCGLFRSVLFVSAVLAPSVLAHQNGSTEPDLSGTWELNQRLSAYSFETPPGGTRKGDGESPVSYEYSSSVAAAQRVARMRELLDVTKKLEIFQQGRELTMNATGGTFVVLTRTIYTDGQLSEQRFGHGDKGVGQGKWNENRFVIETKTERGPKVTEIYELSAGGERLYLSVKIEHESWTQPVYIRRVYDKQVNDHATLN